MSKRIAINALQYKQNSSGIGVMIRDLFGPYTKLTHRMCQVVMSNDAPEFPCGENTQIIRVPLEHKQDLKRVLFQTVTLGRRYGRNAVFLATDSKMPLFLPKSCVAIPLVTDLALYRMPEVYQTSRVLLWKLQYQYTKRRANFYLSISQFTKDEMSAILHIPPDKIHIVPCACSEQMKPVKDPIQLDTLKKQYGLPDQFILFVGNTNPRKNLLRLIRAFDLVKAHSSLPHQLIIAGEQGWKFDREQVLREVKHREDVRFIGFVPDEDMPALYTAASLFVFPTLYEGFGIPVIEAQSCGAPVLTSNVSSLPEVGGDGAYYVDPYDESDICKGIIEVLTNENRSKKLIELGFHNAKRFSWQKSAQQLHEIIERYVKG